MLPKDHLLAEEIAELREFLVRRRWWKQTWAVLRTLHDKLKLLTGLLPWLIGVWWVFGDKLREMLGWLDK